MPYRPNRDRRCGPSLEAGSTGMPERVVDIVLRPGEWYFGDYATRIRTVLGSCVSLTVWHPQRRIGGMCHYMLPKRNGSPQKELDGRFADEALALLTTEMRAAGTAPCEYELKMFGAGSMFPGLANGNDDQHVAARNLAAARQLAAACGLTVVAEQLGGAGHREVFFDVWSGDVWVRHHASLTPQEWDLYERGMNAK